MGANSSIRRKSEISSNENSKQLRSSNDQTTSAINELSPKSSFRPFRPSTADSSSIPLEFNSFDYSGLNRSFPIDFPWQKSLIYSDVLLDKELIEHVKIENQLYLEFLLENKNQQKMDEKNKIFIIQQKEINEEEIIKMIEGINDIDQLDIFKQKDLTKLTTTFFILYQ